MLKFISASVLLLLLQSCEGKSNSKSSDEDTPSAVKNDSSTPSQPVDNTPRIIHGHTLPPEPDPNINSATLLGVDVNHNDVRDDVERWIYMTYKNPIEIGLFMQSARAYQKVIEDPSKAHETTKYLDDVIDCEVYLKYKKKNHPISRYRNIEKEISQIQFNTIERHIAYQRYNAEFSGEVFSAPTASIDKCHFDEYGNLK